MTDRDETTGLSERLAVLEERMKTMDERYDKGWALLREDMAKRETRLLLTVGGLIVTMTALATAILGFLIRLPG